MHLILMGVTICYIYLGFPFEGVNDHEFYTQVLNIKSAVCYKLTRSLLTISGVLSTIGQCPFTFSGSLHVIY